MSRRVKLTVDGPDGQKMVKGYIKIKDGGNDVDIIIYDEPRPDDDPVESKKKK